MPWGRWFGFLGHRVLVGFITGFVLRAYKTLTLFLVVDVLVINDTFVGVVVAPDWSTEWR